MDLGELPAQRNLTMFARMRDILELERARQMFYSDAVEMYTLRKRDAGCCETR